jgi:agmatinase
MAEPRTVLPNSREYPRFAGVCTFARYPQICHVAEKHKPVDWVVYGCPFDGGVTYRPGARFGPRAIRDASQYVKTYHLEHDVAVTEVLSLADGGDAPVRPYSCKETADAITEYASKLGDPGHSKLLALGGDHSIAYANIRATWQRRGKPKKSLALIHFDAHLDTVDSVWGEKWGHASPFIRAIEDGLIDPTRMISIGIRGPLNTKSDLDYAKAKGITIVTADQWRHEGGRDELRDFVARLEGAEAYLSLDIDVADPVFAPGTGTPAIGGFTSAEILSALQSLAPAANLVGADVVEVLPDRDVSQVTAHLAAQVAFEILAIDAVRDVGA